MSAKEPAFHVAIKLQHILEADDQLDDLLAYPDWTYQNTFGVYETCGLPTPENKTSWP